MASFMRQFSPLNLQGIRSSFRAMHKNGKNTGGKIKIRVPEVISFGPRRRASIRGRLNARFLAAGSAFLVAGVFLLVALIQPLSRDGIEARLGPSVALAETPKGEVAAPLEEERPTAATGTAESGTAKTATARSAEEDAADEEFEVAALNDAARLTPV